MTPPCPFSWRPRKPTRGLPADVRGSLRQRGTQRRRPDRPSRVGDTADGWETTWASDGRATRPYGPEVGEGEPPVVGRRIDAHGWNDTGVNIDEIQAAFDDVLDQAVVFHGFTDYMRDYDIFIYVTADPRTGTRPQHLRYRFKHCVRAVVTSAVPPEVWKRSLDERLIDYEQGVNLDGYVWGAKWQVLYPGMKLLDDSPEAKRWSRFLDRPFHEASIEMNGHNISLVFSDLEVDTVDVSHVPFAVTEGGPNVEIPLSSIETPAQCAALGVRATPTGHVGPIGS